MMAVCFFITPCLHGCCVQEMRSAVTSLQGSVARMEVQELSARLARLPDIKLPAKTVAKEEKQDRGKEEEAGAAPGDLGSLMARCNKARQELYTLMANQQVRLGAGLPLTFPWVSIWDKTCPCQFCNLREKFCDIYCFTLCRAVN